MKKTQKAFKRQVETLQNKIIKLEKKIKKLDKKDDKERAKSTWIYKQVDAMRKSLAGNDSELGYLPKEIESVERSIARDKWLYIPMQEAIEYDDLNISDYIFKGDTPEAVVEYVEDSERGIIDQQAEFIYYSEAMDYLHENDQSLTYSLELAKNAGYDIDSINSCILASLLKQDDENMYGKFNEDLEALRDKAEEIREERDKIQEEQGKDIEDIIEDEAQEKAQERIKELWKPEELTRIEKLEAQMEARYQKQKATSQKLEQVKSQKREAVKKLENLIGHEIAINEILKPKKKRKWID